jgi:hypothetical protein
MLATDGSPTALKATSAAVNIAIGFPLAASS